MVLSGPRTRVGRCRIPARCCGRHRTLAAAAGRLCSSPRWRQRFSFTRAGPAACHQRHPREKAPDTPTALGPRIPKLKSSLDRRSQARIYGDIGASEASHLQHCCFPFFGEPGEALGGSTSPVEDPFFSSRARPVFPPPPKAGLLGRRLWFCGARFRASAAHGWRRCRWHRGSSSQINLCAAVLSPRSGVPKTCCRGFKKKWTLRSLPGDWPR